jgi:hypothetical protein
MRNLKLPGLKLGLRDLFDKREADLLLTEAGKYYKSQLVSQLAAIDELPAALTGTPLAEELSAVDADHDGFGAAVYFTTEVYLRLPDAAPEIVAAAKRIRAAFIPALGDISEPYAVEASNAAERKPSLTELKADLKQFPMAGGGSLLDVAKKFIGKGEELGGLLSDRADASGGGRKGAGQIRAKTVGLLSRLRSDVRDEVAKNPKLPRDLERRVFGYFDTLSAMQASPAAAPAAPSPQPQPQLQPLPQAPGAPEVVMMAAPLPGQASPGAAAPKTVK